MILARNRKVGNLSDDPMRFDDPIRPPIHFSKSR
jgi:hypothetical protein